jgi:hypothetical protein
VWLWGGQYNKEGPEGLARQGRGGRRWSLLPWSKEEALLETFEKRALAGEWITAKQMLPEICRVRERKFPWHTFIVSRSVTNGENWAPGPGT